jgi:hypothetical protein
MLPAAKAVIRAAVIPVVVTPAAVVAVKAVPGVVPEVVAADAVKAVPGDRAVAQVARAAASANISVKRKSVSSV